MNIKCIVKLNFDWTSWIPARLVKFVPTAYGLRQRNIAGGKLDSITTDAIVILESFDKGGVYQVPIERVRVEDET